MTTPTNSIDAARVDLLLAELRMPGVKAIWPRLAAGWAFKVVARDKRLASVC